MRVPLRTDVLRAWLRDRSAGADVVDVRLGQRRPLAGGVASPLVERAEVHAELADGRGLDDAVLAKRASPAELVAMREIASVQGVSTFPELIDSGEDDDGPWLVMPFYAGAPLEWNAEPPDQIYADLARLHAKWLGNAGTLPPAVPRVDADFCRHTLLEYASDSLRRARAEAASPVYDRGLRLLREWGTDDLLYAGLARLPVTFLHGDVYGLNIIAADGGTPPRLVDWGSARIGPAMLDVTAGRRSDGGKAYRDAWHEVTGKPLDPWLSELDRAWSTLFSNGMFVGAVAERFGPEPAAAMLDEAEAAYEKLAALLSSRPEAS